MTKNQITLHVNGRDRELWVDTHRSLLDALHDDLGMADVRYGCGEGVCGTCTVLLDGEPINACLLFAVQAAGHRVTTVATLSGPDAELHPLQESFLARGASQCGFCTPGMMLTCMAMVERGERPTREELRYELVGNLCRCTGYTKILDAAQAWVAEAGAKGAEPVEAAVGADDRQEAGSW